MGLSLSVLSSAWNEIVYLNYFYMNEILILKSISFNRKDGEMIMRTISFKKEDSESVEKFGCGSRHNIIERSISFKNWEHATETEAVDNSVSRKVNSRYLSNEKNNHGLLQKWDLKISLPEPVAGFPINDLDAAATKLQKVYKSYRTRRNLADCAVVIEELWWKALDFAALERSSVTFFNFKKRETATSRWLRARTRAAKVGKGLSKDEKAQKLALQHWLEAIDPRHRYGHNLHFYYDVWSDSKSTQPFFYWLNVGDGKELNLEASCSRANLQRQCINYLAPKEREAFEVIVENGKLLYKQNETLLTTKPGTKWIFVLSTTRSLYVGEKKKGVFQHSSFLCGGATTAAGRLVASEGVLEAIWPYSGHYLPTEENFMEFIGFLEEHHVDLSGVKRLAVDEDYISSDITQTITDPIVLPIDTTVISTDTTVLPTNSAVLSTELQTDSAELPTDTSVLTNEANTVVLDLGRPLSCNWSSGLGARIGCVREYPAELQARALEQVSLSPGNTGAMARCNVPIPSPRPSPKIRLSPRLSYMGIPSPRVR